MATWGAVFARQEELLERFACKEYLDILPLMKRYCGYAKDNIPQQEDISAFLQVVRVFVLFVGVLAFIGQLTQTPPLSIDRPQTQKRKPKRHR